jgi:hypothetical protein
VAAPASAETPLVVLRLSDSFAEFWPLVARELGVPLIITDPADEVLPGTVVAVVLAAGGAESEVAPLLGRLSPPQDAPVLVVGATVSHRVAAQAVAAGAAD